MDTIAVPLTEIFIAMIAAFSLPKDVKDCKMVSEGQTTIITRTVTDDSTVVTFAGDEETMRYTFRGTSVTLLATFLDPVEGQSPEATATYELNKEFGITDTKQLAQAAETVLRSNGKTVTMQLKRGDRELAVTDAGGDAAGVFRQEEMKFPPVKFDWK